MFFALSHCTSFAATITRNSEVQDVGTSFIEGRIGQFSQIQNGEVIAQGQCKLLKNRRTKQVAIVTKYNTEFKIPMFTYARAVISEGDKHQIIYRSMFKGRRPDGSSPCGSQPILTFKELLAVEKNAVEIRWEYNCATEWMQKFINRCSIEGIR